MRKVGEVFFSRSVHGWHSEASPARPEKSLWLVTPQKTNVTYS